MAIYNVQIGSRSTNIRMSPNTLIDIGDGFEGYTLMIPASVYDGHYHNRNGMFGAMIERAVRKLWGKKYHWFGDCDDRQYGQVVHCSGSTATGNVCITIIRK